MWFAALGPLQVSGESGDPVSVSTGQQGRLLALLLASAGELVPADRLVDLLWPDTAPDTARTNLQVNVHRLRRILGSDRILRDHGGYRLVVDPAELDTARFEALSASGSYREALVLWRGSAYADFVDLDPVREEAARLEELRLVTLAERIDYDLDHGRHARLVAELQGLVSQYPWREQFREQLMLALHRSGRSPDALESYRAGRDLLIDELGVEPGSGLQQLQQRILAGDPALDLDAAVDLPPTQQPVPAELSAETGTFTGRVEELDLIGGQLTKDGTGAVRIVAIAGPGGVGKSSLAMEAARRAADEFPDGQLYVNLRGATPGLPPLRPEEALARMLRSLGVAGADIPDDVDEAAGRLRTLTAHRTVLIVLDDAVGEAQVHPLLPGGSTSAVLVTSRGVLTGLEGAIHHELSAMEPTEACALLAAVAGSDRTGAEQEATAELARLCDHLPLALGIAGAKLSRRPHWPVSALVTRMADAQRRLDELTTTDRAVRASFDVSCADLSEPTARVLRLVSLLDALDVGVPVAAALIGASEGVAGALLEELLDAQLVVSYAPDRYHLHDLVRLFARELAVEHETETERQDAIRQGVHFYLATGLNAEFVQTPDSWRSRFVPQPLEQPGLPVGNDAEIGAWLSVEADNLVSMTRQAAEIGEDGPALAAAYGAALFAPLNTRGRWQQLRAIQLIGLDATDGPEYDDQRALLKNDFGWVESLLGHEEQAESLVREALEHWRAIGDRRGEAVSHRILAGVLRPQGDYEGALEHARAARDLHREEGSSLGELDCLIAVGLACSRLDRIEDAIAAYEEALELGGPQGDLWHTCVLVGNLADLHRKSGQHAEAVHLFERAIELDGATGNSGTYFEAEHLWGMGRSLYALGDVRESRSCWDRSATLLRNLRLIGPEEFDTLMRTPVPEIPEVIARQL